MAYSQRLEQVLGAPGGILDGVSGTQMAYRIARRGRKLSGNAALNLKKGMFGREDTLRAIGWAYAPELLERHRADIEAVYGRADESLAEEWLVHIARESPAPIPTPTDTPLEGTVGETGLTLERLAETTAQLVADKLRASVTPEAAARQLLDAARRTADTTREPEMEHFSLEGYDGAENLSLKDRRLIEEATRALLRQLAIEKGQSDS